MTPPTNGTANIPSRGRNLVALACKAFPYRRRVEPESWPWTVTEPDRAKLVGVSVHVVGADAEPAGDLGGVDQVRADAVTAQQFQDAGGDGGDRVVVEPDRGRHRAAPSVNARQ